MHYDEAAGRGEFLWTHTTSSMGIAFQTTADKVTDPIGNFARGQYFIYPQKTKEVSFNSHKV